MLTGAELARTLGVSRPRVSQYVSEGKLDGCFNGEGRARRFDLAAVTKALGSRLDSAQMLGNGADTRRTLLALRAQSDDDAKPVVKPRSQVAESELLATDPDRYELARTQKAEEEARKLRRQNAEAEGLYLLASETERQVAKLMAQEVAEFETVLRDGARRVADKLGVDFKTARQILVDTWRGHREGRSAVLVEQAAQADMSAIETEGDI